MSTMRLEVEGLSADYGREPVLTNVSLLVGTGAGHGHCRPQRQRQDDLPARGLGPDAADVRQVVKLDGERIDHLSAERIARLGVIHVPQGDLVYKKMTVRDNLLVGGYDEPQPHRYRRASGACPDAFPAPAGKNVADSQARSRAASAGCWASGGD
jgi:branched-chain amino acid transport system ATP-binding protein